MLGRLASVCALTFVVCLTAILTAPPNANREAADALAFWSAVLFLLLQGLAWALSDTKMQSDGEQDE